MLFRKPKVTPDDGARALREQAFTISAQDVHAAPGAGHRRVCAMFMESRVSRVAVSLICFTDGTTSLYFGNGGGIIGAGGHEAVRAAADRFITDGESFLPSFEPTVEYPLPAEGRILFYARTFDGLMMASADEKTLGQQRHLLSPLFLSAHAVISAIRESDAVK